MQDNFKDCGIHVTFGLMHHSPCVMTPPFKRHMMDKRKGLKKLFKKFAMGAVLGLGVMAGPAASADDQSVPRASTVDSDSSCPAYPNFKKPIAPMHRAQPRDMTPDPELRDRQKLLQQIGMSPGRADGLKGSGTRAASREYLMFYAPIYGGDPHKGWLDDADAIQLAHYAQQARSDARLKGITTAQAAALRLSAERTGADFDKLTAAARRGGQLKGVNSFGAAPGDMFKFDNPSWLYLVKFYGAEYGMGVYAQHITFETVDGKTAPTVTNPFIHRQLLDLKHEPRLSALMAGEFLKNQPDLSNLAAPKVSAYSAETLDQQKDLQAIGFDIGTGPPDGKKGTFMGIAIREFQLLYGEGNPTGTLTVDEAATLKQAADRARKEGRSFVAPTVATGAIHMAAERSGLEFGYMMELAEAESGFSHRIRASTSTATGMYQFIESTWSWMIMLHGDKYGLGALASEVELYKDDLGRSQARINNPVLRREIMELRKNPHLSSLMSAHFQKENRGKEQCFVDGGDIKRTDMYIAHFLGAHDAIYFINQMRANPGQSAAATFPEAAQANENIFYVMKNGRRVSERSLEDVYKLFSKKFDRDRYDNDAPRIVKAPDEPLGPAPAG